MIRSFKCSDTETLFKLNRVKRFVNIERPALRKLEQLDFVRLLRLFLPSLERVATYRNFLSGTNGVLHLMKGRRRDHTGSHQSCKGVHVRDVQIATAPLSKCYKFVTRQAR